MKSSTIKFRHEFVVSVPDVLEEKVFYVSTRFCVVSHLCPCGCKSEVVTPISPTDWELIFDGESITLDPSIGNWTLPCRSHYWIRRNKIKWSGNWSESKIEKARKHDKDLKNWFFNKKKKNE